MTSQARRPRKPRLSEDERSRLLDSLVRDVARGGADHAPEGANAWIASQLESLDVTWDDFDAVYRAVENEIPSPPDAEDVPVPNVERMIVRSLRKEAQAIAETDEWLWRALSDMPDFDWDAVARLSGANAATLRARAERPSVGDAPPLGVGRTGITTAEAQAALGIGRSTLFRWLDDGRLRRVPDTGTRLRIQTDGSGMPVVFDPAQTED